MKNLSKDVDKLKRMIDNSRRTKNGYKCMNSGDVVTVDYFALCNLIKFYEMTKNDVNRVLIARDMLNKTFFGFQPVDKEEVIKGA
jgi:hypothetical protein